MHAALLAAFLKPLARRTLGALTVLALSSGLAQAQSGGVKLMVGFPPGGGTDAIARILADKLKDQLATTVVVENKAGAGGQLAASERVHKPNAVGKAG